MPLTTTRRSAPAALAVLLLAGLAACDGSDDTEVVAENPQVRTTAHGRVEGSTDTARGAYAWLGVPYAQPPVGPLRWMPPRAPAAWDGTRSARAFGRSCAQPGSFYAPPKADDGFSRDIANTFGQRVGDEDCLTLNIWRPLNTDTRLPVLVWFHGGANTVGYSSNPGYHGANFARVNNAIVVTVNYRLGVFGWLRHPALHVDGDALANSGNFGLLDQIRALEFVKTNIANFGGDPDNVTLMGQSAGAVDAYGLMLSPLTKDRGLFHKVVAMSGGVRPNAVARADSYAASVLPKALVISGQATSANVASVVSGMSPTQVAEALRAMPTDVLALTSPGQADNIGDGTVLPVSAEDAVANGAYRNVPLMIGLTADESKTGMQAYMKINEQTLFTFMYDFDPDQPAAPGAPTLADILKPEVTVDAYNAAAAAAMAANAGAWSDNALNLFGPKQAKTYAYLWTWAQGPEPWKTIFGAGHGLDVAFMFGTFGKGMYSINYTQANKAGREALSDAMMRSVGAFMRTGDPNHAALGTPWAPWTVTSPKRLVLDATPTDKRIAMQ